MPNEIGSTLKKYRNEAHISVKQISDILIKKGFKASEKTIYSWESGNSQPTPDALLIMCDAYGIKDVLSAFGYNGYDENGRILLNMYELDIIEKYRELDAHGKEMIDFTLHKEWERSVSIEKVVPYSPVTQAAHNDHQEEAGEQEKMQEDLSNLKRPE